MRSLLSVVAGVLLCATPAVAQLESDHLQALSPRVLSRFGLERAWWNQATLQVGRDTIAHMTLDEENLYIQATSGLITAFDSENGKRRWAVQLGPRDAPSYPAVSNEEVILVAAGMKLYCLDKFQGNLLWEIKLPHQPSTSPAADADRVYIGTLDGSVYAFDLRKVHELYDERLLPQWSAEALAWRYQSGRQINSPPISTGRVVNFASMDGSLYTVGAEERNLLWQFETDAPVSAPLARSDGVLFVASEDFSVYAIKAENGQITWQFVSGYPVRKAPRVVGPDLFLTPDRGGMFRLDKNTGDQKWWRPRLTDFLTATDNLVFASDRIGNVVVLAREDGAVLGALPLRNFSQRLSNDRTDRLYLATQNGLVVCLRQRGAEFPTYHMYPERRPILPDFAPEGEAPAEPAADAANANSAGQ